MSAMMPTPPPAVAAGPSPDMAPPTEPGMVTCPQCGCVFPDPDAAQDAAAAQAPPPAEPSPVKHGIDRVKNRMSQKYDQR